jgi:hypothetical protein
MKCSSLALVLAAAAPLTALSVAEGPASASGGTPKGGMVEFYEVTPNGSQTSTVVITGAVADVGTDMATSGGADSVLTLRSGTIDVHSAALDHKLATAVPRVNPANCGATLTVTGDTKVVSGTGTYQGIKGTIHVVFSTAAVLPKLSNGKCDESNSAVPLGVIDWIHGTGKVSFSS